MTFLKQSEIMLSFHLAPILKHCILLTTKKLLLNKPGRPIDCCQHFVTSSARMRNLKLFVLTILHS